jgi:hypothetical protein
MILMQVVLKLKFNFSISKSLSLLTGIFFILLALSLACIYLLDYPKAYFSGAFFFLIATVLSLIELNKRMDLKALVNITRKKFF